MGLCLTLDGGNCKWCIPSYRPQINIQTGHIMGAEALPRWQYPELGRVSLAEFVPNAEDSGMILSIGGLGPQISPGLQTIAEGAETAEQRAFLRAQDCDEAQRHLLFSKASAGRDV
ncbi:MAG: hypothetical protein CTY16_20070 [Methylobacter sp.]|nr:MAG: hypothetical protein CTY16_20070 [Methylobacter sp.]